MKFAVALLAALLVVAPSMGLRARHVTMPTHPSYSLEKWNQILSNQEPKEEVCTGCVPGTKPQSPLAGRFPLNNDKGTAIINGNKASKGQFPYQVGITMDDEYFCGGSILSENWVLTAGHCVDGISSFSVVFGSLSPFGDRNAVTRTSRTSILHSGYDEETVNNDIGLVKIGSAVSFNSYIAPIKLPSGRAASKNLVGTSATVSGWGKTSDWGGMSQKLMYVNLDIVDNSVGVNYFGEACRATNIVADGSKYRSTCNGDSGGPLVQTVNGVVNQYGIVSYGAAAGCAAGYPSVFTRVTSYTKWISSNTGLQF